MSTMTRVLALHFQRLDYLESLSVGVFSRGGVRGVVFLRSQPALDLGTISSFRTRLPDLNNFGETVASIYSVRKLIKNHY